MKAGARVLEENSVSSESSSLSSSAASSSLSETLLLSPGEVPASATVGSAPVSPSIGVLSLPMSASVADQQQLLSQEDVYGLTQVWPPPPLRMQTQTQKPADGAQSPSSVSLCVREVPPGVWQRRQ